MQILPAGGTFASNFGANIARGLSEQVPKEVERHRLSSGLKSLSENKGNLSPFQRFSQLLTLPGITPQGIQSGADLLKQEGVSQALMQQAQEANQPRPNPFIQQGQEFNQSRPDTLSTRDPLEAKLNNPIPKTFQEIQQRAGQLMQSNPALYGNDPDKALDAAQYEEAQIQKRNEAFQARRTAEQEVEASVESKLSKQRADRNVDLPEDVYESIRKEAVNSVKSRKDGGEGLTETEARNIYGNKLEQVARQYANLDALGDWGMLFSPPGKTKSTLKALSDDFYKRGDERNLAQLLVAKHDLSPMKAYSIASPIDRESELNQEFKKIKPNIVSKVSGAVGQMSNTPGIGKALNVATSLLDPFVDSTTLEASKKLAPLLGKNGSVLSVAQGLKDKGLNPQIWIQYVRDNKDSLNLTERQADELGKTDPWIPKLNDYWLSE